MMVTSNSADIPTKRYIGAGAAGQRHPGSPGLSSSAAAGLKYRITPAASAIGVRSGARGRAGSRCKRLRAKGVHPREAAYLGREISTDFAMRGDSKTLGFFYDTVMFLRPAVVSMDRLFRGVAHDPNRGAIAVKTATIALMSAALFLLNRDRDEYKDLEDWDRDSYWHFFVPTPNGESLHFRYPKIWEVGAIATLAERTVERILEGAPKEYAKDFGRVLRQAFNLNFMPQILAPAYEQAVNRITFTGRPIEPPVARRRTRSARRSPRRGRGGSRSTAAGPFRATGRSATKSMSAAFSPGFTRRACNARCRWCARGESRWSSAAGGPATCWSREASGCPSRRAPRRSCRPAS